MLRRCMQRWPFLQGSNKEELTLDSSSRPMFPPYVPVRAASTVRTWDARTGDLRRRRVWPSCAYPPSLMRAVWNPAIRPGGGFPVLLNDGRGLNVGCASRLEPGCQYMAFAGRVIPRFKSCRFQFSGFGWVLMQACDASLNVFWRFRDDSNPGGVWC